MLNVDAAEYDRSLFWRITKALLVIGAVLIAVDAGWGLLMYASNESCAFGFFESFTGVPWDELREFLGL
jgi:hypothetical protein